jgi:hypothetical protein
VHQALYFEIEWFRHYWRSTSKEKDNDMEKWKPRYTSPRFFSMGNWNMWYVGTNEVHGVLVYVPLIE